MWMPAARAVVSGEVAQRTRPGTELAGGSVAFGYEILYPVDPSINRRFYGEAMGIEARGHFLRSRGEDPNVWLVQAGAAFSSYKLFKGSAGGRMRFPAIFPLLLPEVGAAFEADEPAKGYLRWSAPLAFLIHRNFAIELAPSVSLIGPDPKPNPDVLVGLSFGISFREIRERPADPEGWDEWTTTVDKHCFTDWWNQSRAPRGPLLELGAARPYRRYFAVTSVRPMAHYFASASSRNPHDLMFRVEQNDVGLRVEFVGTSGEAPSLPGNEPVPAELEGLAMAVESQVRKECDASGLVESHYAGAYREVIVEEFVLKEWLENPRRARGWRTMHRVAMDEGLTRVLHSRGTAFGLVLLELPQGSQWLAASGIPAFKPLDPPLLPEALANDVADAARRFAAGAPPAELASLVPANEPSIPPSLSAHLRLTVSVNFPHSRAPTSQAEVLKLSIVLPDAVFGPGATSQVKSSTVGGEFTLRATLTPTTPSAKLDRPHPEKYQGTLALHVEDALGRTWDQSFLVGGFIELDGGGVLAPKGLTIAPVPPMTSVEALRGELPRMGKAGAVLIFVDDELPQEEGK